jgi:hypothetical protein
MKYLRAKKEKRERDPEFRQENDRGSFLPCIIFIYFGQELPDARQMSGRLGSNAQQCDKVTLKIYK